MLDIGRGDFADGGAGLDTVYVSLSAGEDDAPTTRYDLDGDGVADLTVLLSGSPGIAASDLVL